MFGRVLNLFREVFVTPMPMDDYGSYDAYWDRRINETGPLLFRYRFIADCLPHGGSLLDIGCGDGRFLRHVRNVRPNLKVKGVDGSPKAVEYVRSCGIDADVFDASSDDLTDTPDHFDCVVIMELLEHLPEPERLMRQVRAINPARVYITIPNMGCYRHRLRLALGGRMPLTAILFHIKEHIRFWTVADFKYWSSQLGFEVLHCYGQSPSALKRNFPSLFSAQVIYELKPTSVLSVNAPNCVTL